MENRGWTIGVPGGGVNSCAARIAMLPISVSGPTLCHCEAGEGQHWQAYYDGPVPLTSDTTVAFFANGHTEREAIDRLERVLMDAIHRDYRRQFPTSGE